MISDTSIVDYLQFTFNASALFNYLSTIICHSAFLKKSVYRFAYNLPSQIPFKMYY